MSSVKISTVRGIFVHVLFVLNRKLAEHIPLCYNLTDEKKKVSHQLQQSNVNCVATDDILFFTVLYSSHLTFFSQIRCPCLIKCEFHRQMGKHFPIQMQA
jgi:hypothetical protein